MIQHPQTTKSDTHERLPRSWGLSWAGGAARSQQPIRASHGPSMATAALPAAPAVAAAAIISSSQHEVQVQRGHKVGAGAGLPAASAAFVAARLGLLEQLAAAAKHPGFGGWRDADGRSCLHFAAGLGHDDCVELILERCGSDAARARDSHGDTALHLAAQSGHAMVAYNLAAVRRPQPPPACMLHKATANTPTLPGATISMWTVGAVGALCATWTAINNRLHAAHHFAAALRLLHQQSPPRSDSAHRLPVVPSTQACTAACMAKNKAKLSPIEIAAATRQGEVLNAMLLACSGVCACACVCPCCVAGGIAAHFAAPRVRAHALPDVVHTVF